MALTLTLTLTLARALTLALTQTLTRYLRAWFEKEAQQDAATMDLHKLSAWAYLSKSQFSEIVLNASWQMSPPIKRGSSVFELGCGVSHSMYSSVVGWAPHSRP